MCPPHLSPLPRQELAPHAAVFDDDCSFDDFLTTCERDPIDVDKDAFAALQQHQEQRAHQRQHCQHQHQQGQQQQGQQGVQQQEQGLQGQRGGAVDRGGGGGGGTLRSIRFLDANLYQNFFGHLQVGWG
jgi:hypothetical protein